MIELEHEWAFGGLGAGPVQAGGGFNDLVLVDDLAVELDEVKAGILHLFLFAIAGFVAGTLEEDVQGLPIPWLATSVELGFDAQVQIAVNGAQFGAGVDAAAIFAVDPFLAVAVGNLDLVDTHQFDARV